MENNTSIFQIPDGERASLTTGFVFDDEGNQRCNLTYEATATGEYVYATGAIRRRFIDASIEFFPGVTDIWLSGEDEDVECHEKNLKLVLGYGPI